MPCKTCCLPTTVNMRFLAAFLVLSILVVADCTPLTFKCDPPNSKYEKISSDGVTDAFYLALVNATSSSYVATCYYTEQGRVVTVIDGLLNEFAHFLESNKIFALVYIVTRVRASEVSTGERIKVHDFTPLGDQDIWVPPKDAYVMYAVKRKAVFGVRDLWRKFDFKKKFYQKINRNTEYPIYYACTKKC